MKKSIWILCLALTIAGCFAFCKTVYAAPKFGSGSSTLPHSYMPGRIGEDLEAAPTFGSDSSTLTHPYMPMRIGDNLTYKSYGWPSVSHLHVDAVAEENIDQVECLKIKMSSPELPTYIEYYWFAQDIWENLWMLQYQDVESGYFMFYGSYDAKLIMPAQVGVGMILWDGAETVVATDVTVPQLSTGFGPFYHCIKSIADYGGGDIDYQYYAPHFGQIKLEFNDDGGINGFEISSFPEKPNSQIGVFRPSDGMWFLDRSDNGSWNDCTTDKCINFGIQGDIPVTGDWNGDGTTKIGVFRPSIGWWFLDYNGNGQWDGCATDRCYNFGISEDTPVTGDWDGDGKTEIGLFRKSIGMWFLDYNGDGAWSGCWTDRCYNFGISEDTPVTGDWNGYGKTNIGVFRKSIGMWFLDLDGTGTWWGCGIDGCYNFGISEDLPVTGDWNGDGLTEIGVFRPSIGYWFLDHNGDHTWNNCTADRCYQFGISLDLPVSGAF
jgi:hypothetical protein